MIDSEGLFFMYRGKLSTDMERYLWSFCFRGQSVQEISLLNYEVVWQKNYGDIPYDQFKSICSNIESTKPGNKNHFMNPLLFVPKSCANN